MKKEEVKTRLNPKFFEGVAHRGLHDKETITENSLASFKKAISLNLPFEFDVHLSKDNEVIVIHDSETKRVTDKEGVVEELTLKEIKDNYRLKNGETIPTLKEVIEINNNETPMVIELKPSKKHKNSRILAQKVIELIKDLKKENIIIISFYPSCLFPFKKYGYIRLFLADYKHRYVLHIKNLFEGLDLEYTYFKNKKYQSLKGKRVIFSWTIENEEDLLQYTKFVDSVTFQYLEVEKVKEVINNS